MKKVIIRNHIMQITTLCMSCSIRKVSCTVFLISVTPEAAVHRCSSKCGFLKVSQYLQENTCVGVFFNNVVDLKTCNFINRWIQHKCFPVNIAKFLRTRFLQNTSRGLLLKTFLGDAQPIIWRLMITLKTDVNLFSPLFSLSREQDVDVQNVLFREVLFHWIC